MFSRFGQKAARNTASRFLQQRRAFGSDAEHAMPEPSFLAAQGPSHIFYSLVAPSIAIVTLYTTLNTSAQIYYPDETEALVIEWKQGLRNNNFSVKDE